MNKFLKTILRRVIISAMTEGVIKRVDATGVAGEEFLDREAFQHYGFTSRAKSGAEGIIIGIGNVFYLIAEDDRRCRIALEDGEVALYTDEGDYVHLKRGGIIEILGGAKVIANTPALEVNATTSAKITSPVVELGDGTLRRLIDERVVEKINDFISNGHNLHVHTGNLGAPTSAPTVPAGTVTLDDVATEKTKGS